MRAILVERSIFEGPPLANHRCFPHDHCHVVLHQGRCQGNPNRNADQRIEKLRRHKNNKSVQSLFNNSAEAYFARCVVAIDCGPSPSLALCPCLALILQAFDVWMRRLTILAALTHLSSLANKKSAKSTHRQGQGCGKKKDDALPLAGWISSASFDFE